MLTSPSLGPSPASAVPLHWDFAGHAHVDCFGCGVPSRCHADLVILGVTHSGTAETTSCTATDSAGALCVLSGTAFGTLVGTSGTAAGITLDFSSARMGSYAVITVSGDTTGMGHAVFLGPLTCGGPVDGTVVGSISGV